MVNSSTQNRIKKFQLLQNRAARLVEGRTGYISTEDMEALHVKLNLRILGDRRKISMLKMIYKLSRNIENMHMYRPERVL